MATTSEWDRSSPPSPEGLERLAAALGGTAVSSVRRLGGGVAAATCELVLESPGAARRLVLKRYPPGDATALLEWDRLRYAVAAEVATPEPVALDFDCAWFGVPALVMSRLPGRVDLEPDDLGDWARQLAHALVMIHRTAPAPEIPATLLRPYRLSHWQLWDVDVDARIAAAADVIERLKCEADDEPGLFCHADFHPGNVLFEAGALTGVVDWSAARYAPPALDVAHCRADLAIFPGGEAPDLFLAAYRAAASHPLDGLARWEVLEGMHALQFSPGWLESFAEEGVELTQEGVRASVESFLDGALGRC